jgi:hypothetical protein
MTTTTTYGPFSFDGINVRGPKAYMDERGLALLDAILAGDDPLYDPGAYPDEETAVLGRLCEDFDDWRAAR